MEFQWEKISSNRSWKCQNYYSFLERVRICFDLLKLFIFSKQTRYHWLTERQILTDTEMKYKLRGLPFNINLHGNYFPWNFLLKTPAFNLNMLKGVKLRTRVSWSHVNGLQFPKRRMGLCFISSVRVHTVGGNVNIDRVAVCIVSGITSTAVFRESFRHWKS